ncbi:MAG: hypothetical protein ACI9JN_002562 [Bacteroidia bacterium]|jgi:hypothetical protein
MKPKDNKNMKLSQYSISVLFLLFILVSSCSQRKYGHLTIKVGGKKHQTVKTKSTKPIRSALPSDLAILLEVENSIPGSNKLTTIQQSATYSNRFISLENEQIEPVTTRHSNKRAKSNQAVTQIEDKHVVNVQNAKSKETTSTNMGHFNRDSLILAATATMTGTISLLMLFGRRRLRKHVEWAKKNKKLARGLLIASRVLLGLLGLQLGAMAADVGQVISTKTVAILSIVLALNILAYPKKKSNVKLFRPSLLRRKIQDLVFGTIALALLTSFGNISSQKSNSDSVGARITNVVTIDTNVVQNSDKVEVEKQKTEDVILNILLTILGVVLLAGLLYLTAILSCSLSCSGQESMAILVLIMGIGIGVIGFVFLMGKVWAKP